MLNVNADLTWGMYTALFAYLAPLLLMSIIWYFSTDTEKTSGYLKLFHHYRAPHTKATIHKK